ncbi:hypothetical protein AY498_04800 [Corynebacterium ulcerans]|nr:hypothetical protein BRL53_07235 [Corynebacterium ulcerans]PME07717.1 hypothetical protein AY498_04800 [Corynebacterium ulcerans]
MLVGGAFLWCGVLEINGKRGRGRFVLLDTPVSCAVACLLWGGKPKMSFLRTLAGVVPVKLQDGIFSVLKNDKEGAKS